MFIGWVRSELLGGSPSSCIFDKLMQGRVFSYADTQRHRLGPNYLQLAVNRPQVPVDNNQRDGAMQQGSYKGTVNYEPNTLAGVTPHEAQTLPNEELTLSGKVIRQKIGLTSDFQQAGERYRALSKVDQDRLVDNIADSLGKAEKPIRMRMIGNLKKADAELGKRIATALKLE